MVILSGSTLLWPIASLSLSTLPVRLLSALISVTGFLLGRSCVKEYSTGRSAQFSSVNYVTTSNAVKARVIKK